jgi:ribosome-associated protein
MENSPDHLVFRLARHALDKKARNIVILDVSKFATYASYLIICHGTSDRHVQAIGEHIEEEMLKEYIKPMGVEGMHFGQWVLLDFGDVVIHIFYQPKRDHFDLEGLWAEAPRVVFPDAQIMDAEEEPAAIESRY